MLKLNIKKFLLGLSIVYLLFGTFSIVQNHGLVRPVSRGQYPEHCQTLKATDINLVVSNPECVDTDDLRWGFNWNLIQWRFLSDNRGFDQTRYIPIDLLASFALVSALIFKIRNRND